jgi:hypothetical protein
MLVIPGLNDDETEFKNMTRWIATELGNDVPLHLSRYFPQHEMHQPPTPRKHWNRFSIWQKTPSPCLPGKCKRRKTIVNLLSGLWQNPC